MAMGMEVDERFHPLVEGTSAAIFVFDAKKILYINPACKRLTGRPLSDLYPKTPPRREGRTHHTYLR